MDTAVLTPPTENKNLLSPESARGGPGRSRSRSRSLSPFPQSDTEDAGTPRRRSRSPSPYMQDASLSEKVAMFQSHAERHQKRQSLNPFSAEGKAANLDKPVFSKEEYGRPEKGSQSEIRAHKAWIQIGKEMLELCNIIYDNGAPYDDEGRYIIFFGELFNIYTHISDKLVGMLLRARKHKLLDFEGEVLFQRRDDNVPIILQKTIEEIRAWFKQKDEEARKAIEECEMYSEYAY